MKEYGTKERCKTCQWPLEHCQCNTKMGATDRPNPFLACPWCGHTTTRDLALAHIPKCAENPLGCDHAHLCVDTESAEKNIVFCPECQFNYIVPAWMRLYNAVAQVSIP